MAGRFHDLFQRDPKLLSKEWLACTMLKFIVEYHLVKDTDYEKLEEELMMKFPQNGEIVREAVKGLVAYLDA